MTFVVGGFNENEPYGRVYLFTIPNAPTPNEQHPSPTPQSQSFGFTWGGQREFIDRIVQGYDGRAPGLAKTTLNLTDDQLKQLERAFASLQMQVPIQVLSLQDCIDLAIFFIRMTISAQKLTVGIRGVGGPIDVATITRIEPFTFVQQKKLLGEYEEYDEETARP
jgi:hypothetical protein